MMGTSELFSIALISINALSLEQAVASIHLPTMALLFAFMVVSAQMRLGGFYDWVTQKLAGLALSPASLLGVLIGVSAALSAVLGAAVLFPAVSK